MDRPERGERVTIFWPNGPYDFHMEVDHCKDLDALNWPGWFLVVGAIDPTPKYPYREWRTFYVHPVEHGYALLPMRKS